MEEPRSDNLLMIDVAYEFSAPQFYDFTRGETDNDVREAELWFENSLPYAPSPFMPRIKATRSVQLQILCNFGEDDQMHKAAEASEAANVVISATESTSKAQNQTKPPSQLIYAKTEEVPREDHYPAAAKENNLEAKKTMDVNERCTLENESLLAGKTSSSLPAEAIAGQKVCTPAPSKPSGNKKLQTAKKIASMITNPSAVNPKNHMNKSQAKSSIPASVRRDKNVKNIAETPKSAHENQAIKRQKLDGGKSRQILDYKPPNLPHKTKSGIVTNITNFCSSAAKTCKQDRKMFVREPAVPFVSMAEMMKKFQSSTREMSLPCRSSVSQKDGGTIQRKPKLLTLTRPKTPEFETSQRVRSTKIKSSTELEEEMLAKLPKFKARPVNKKIFGAPTFPAPQRSTPHPPEFKEFHLETMSRANQNVETSTVASTESTREQNHQWNPHHLTAPRSPHLQTSLRARPTKIKSSEEIEKEKLEQIPQFKARPLNRKIFESKGDMGIFCNMKKQVTIPQEFHFEVDKRIPPPTAVVDQFDKLSIWSEFHQEKQLPRNTTPNPFHLHTEERGEEKERRMAEEHMQKKLEEEKARVPRAHPYPYTTDYPVVPPKPEPKPCTKPEPFQLESLLRHEEELQREIEERRRMELEEAQMRIFKAQPVLKEDPIPMPEKARMPLTEVQEFDLHVNHRAADRAEFDKRVKEKEMMYKRYRDEAESAKLMEEEKALKQLRRTLVPHARPVPKFDNPFLPQKSVVGVTKAKSPKLLIDRRKQIKRRVVQEWATATSAAASHMR